MARAVIADSDDEGGNDYSPIQSPGPQPVVGAEQIQPLSYPAQSTESTDPLFFQSVFNEQNEAAANVFYQTYENPHAGLNITQDQDELLMGHQDDVMLLPALNATEKGSGKPYDPYEFPSSADEPTRRVEPTHGTHQSSSSRSAKRRKTEKSQASQGNFSKPISYKETGREEDYGIAGEDPFALPPTLPPTLPIGSKPSIYIAPDALTNSQREMYSSVTVPSSPSQNCHKPGEMRRHELKLDSSSIATNVNTPRDENSTPNLANAAPQTQMSPLATKTLKTRPDQKMITSSPDVISSTHPGKLQPMTGGEATSPQEMKSLDAQHGDIKEMATPLKDTPLEESSNTTSEPAQTKRPRGRPKKSSAEDPAQITDAKAPPSTAKKAPAQKRKRGRPKKSDTAVEAQDQPMDEPAPAPTPAPEPGPPTDVKTGVHDESIADDAKPSSALAEPSSNSNKLPVAQVEVKTPTKPPPEKTASAGASTAKKNKGVPASESKPIYRVGLSRKSRIAPLLKVIRK
ncbi:hypothetical protein B0I35DRAFT_478468 [Stachybotrys elegans]|uniref:AT hook domain-containing protein n=1 Tax=Stachybotrys elegans TaxID=80388 RepID=A0A8K0SX69_9HYPO|nr:hypothetical protein B0I35DRAFT_478468 [Stachybotrys elegans]